MRNVYPRTPHLLTLLLILVLALTPGALAQEETEWEYLVVSYGTTYFGDPLTDITDGQASHSKVLLFSELGVTIPSEATTLQRNIDVLGRFGWEMITVVGSIGGDQQIVFKRPYDEERSTDEAERIREEREALIAEYNATQEAEPQDDPTSETPRLVDVDAAERAQATEARNERDAATARSIVETAAAAGFPLPTLTAEGNAWGPDGDADVSIRITQDVTEAALIGPGQYRRSLVDEAVEQFQTSLRNSGFVVPEYGCYASDTPDGEAAVTITAIINHDGTSSEVGTYRESYCFNP